MYTSLFEHHIALQLPLDKTQARPTHCVHLATTSHLAMIAWTQPVALLYSHHGVAYVPQSSWRSTAASRVYSSLRCLAQFLPQSSPFRQQSYCSCCTRRRRVLQHLLLLQHNTAAAGARCCLCFQLCRALCLSLRRTNLLLLLLQSLCDMLPLCD
jgi:hypothetical protein